LSNLARIPLGSPIFSSLGAAAGRSIFSKIGGSWASVEDTELEEHPRWVRSLRFREIGADEEIRPALGMDAERMKSVRATRCTPQQAN
jgi:hypothetical protein